MSIYEDIYGIDNLYIASKAIKRGRRNLKHVKYDYKYSKIDLQEAKNRIFGTIGFFKMGKNSNIIDELLLQTSLRRAF